MSTALLTAPKVSARFAHLADLWRSATPTDAGSSTMHREPKMSRNGMAPTPLPRFMSRVQRKRSSGSVPKASAFDTAVIDTDSAMSAFAEIGKRVTRRSTWTATDEHHTEGIHVGHRQETRHES